MCKQRIVIGHSHILLHSRTYAVVDEAITTLGYGPNLQILSFIGVIELATWKKTFSPEGKPGDLGFDPLKMSVGKSDVAIKNMQLKEIKNGRVAMIGK